MGNLGPVMHVHQRNGLLDMKHLGALLKVINIVDLDEFNRSNHLINAIHVLFKKMMMMMMRMDVPRRCSGWALCKVGYLRYVHPPSPRSILSLGEEDGTRWQATQCTCFWLHLILNKIIIHTEI